LSARLTQQEAADSNTLGKLLSSSTTRRAWTPRRSRQLPTPPTGGPAAPDRRHLSGQLGFRCVVRTSRSTW